MLTVLACACSDPDKGDAGGDGSANAGSVGAPGGGSSAPFGGAGTNGGGSDARPEGGSNANDAGGRATSAAGSGGVAGTTMAGGTAGTAPVERPGYQLIWSDEFDGAPCPNPADWAFEKGFVRNEELQWYQPDNASCADGHLIIEGRRERRTNPNYQASSSDWKRSRQFIDYTSTSMTTSGKHSFTYGRFEARARIDARRGSWPAFWTLGSGGRWPASGEVDIMEFYDSTVLANVCKPAGSECNWSSVRQPLSMLGGSTWAGEYHLWAMEWDAEKIDLLLDERLVNHFRVADAAASGRDNPYVGHPQYLLLNLAIGANGGDPTKTEFPLRYEVDFVRVYRRAE
jgi:beta-glucanase (GH16 family)